MARTPVHLNIVAARERLKPRRDPYWQQLSRGHYLGFRLMTKGSSGTWLAKAYDADRAKLNKYHQKKLGDFSTLEERKRYDAAKVAAEEWFLHLDRGGATQSGTVREACEAYVEHLEGDEDRKRARTEEQKKHAAKDAKARFERLVYYDPIATIDLAKLKNTQVNAWKKRVLAKGGTRGSFNRNATAFRAALNMAWKDGRVTSNLAWVKELAPFEQADGRRDTYLPVADRRKLIEKAARDAQPFIRALALLPLRPGDVAKLTVGDFNAKDLILTVPAGKTKSRKIPLSGEPLAHVRANTKNKLPAAPLFSKADGKPWDRFAWRDAINDAVDAAKLPAAVCAYTLRHSAITDLVKSGLDLFHVAQLCGTSVAMIEKHYGHLQKEQVREGLKVLSLK